MNYILKMISYSGSEPFPVTSIEPTVPGIYMLRSHITTGPVVFRSSDFVDGKLDYFEHPNLPRLFSGKMKFGKIPYERITHHTPFDLEPICYTKDTPTEPGMYLVLSFEGNRGFNIEYFSEKHFTSGRLSFYKDTNSRVFSGKITFEPITE